MKVAKNNNKCASGQTDPREAIAAEFLLFGDGKGTLWCFPRAHLIAADIPAKGKVIFNFGTHQAAIEAEDARGILDGLLDGEVLGVAMTGFRSSGYELKPVSQLTVTPKL